MRGGIQNDNICVLGSFCKRERQFNSLLVSLLPILLDPADDNITFFLILCLKTV